MTKRRRSGRIRRSTTKSHCGQNLKAQCLGPACKWAKHVGCRKSPGFGNNLSVPSSSSTGGRRKKSKRRRKSSRRTYKH
jgi:hypothetical protein